MYDFGSSTAGTKVKTARRRQEEKELPFLLDAGLMAGAYGVTAAGLAATTGPLGVMATSAIAAPVYMAAKYALTGQSPQPGLTAGLVDDPNSVAGTALGAVEDTAMWALTPLVFKGLGVGAGKVAKNEMVKRLRSGVQIIANKTVNPMTKAVEPAGEWLWNKMRIPTQKHLPEKLGGKSMAEMFQPAVERLAEKASKGGIAKAAQSFRKSKVELSLTSELSREFGDKLITKNPRVRYEVAKGLSSGKMAAGTRNREAKRLLSEFDSKIVDLKLTDKYERELRKQITKLSILPDEASPSIIKKLVKSKADSKWYRTQAGEIQKGLKEVIYNPKNSRQAKELAKDLYDLPAKTPMAVEEAGHKASMAMLTSELQATPRVFAKNLKPGYTVSKFKDFEGTIIHKDVELELQAIKKLRKIAEGRWNKYFMTPWKTNKIVLRPATHMKNLFSNVILNDWGGLPFYRMDVYKAALKQMKGNTKGFQEFRRMVGGDIANFSGSDVAQLSHATTHDANIFEKILNVYDRVVKVPRSLYGAEETFFKYAKYMWNIEKKGMSKKVAALDAMKWTFNFSEITPEVAQIGKSLIPFVRWYSKVIPLGLETAAKHPIRMGKWYGFYRAIQKGSLESNHISENEWGYIEQKLPEYMRKGMYMLMPYRDEKQNLNMLDLTYMLPFMGDISELYQRSPIESIVQSPLYTAYGAIANKKKFSGAPLYYDWEDNNTKLAKVFSYAWDQMMPSVMGGPDYQKLYDAFTEKPDSLSPEVAMANFFGMKLVPIDEQKNAKRQRQIKSIYTREISNAMRRELRESTSAEETDEIIQKYMKYRQQLREESI